METFAIVKNSQESPFHIAPIKRRELKEKDVHVEIMYCGICHSDVHVAFNEWKQTIYPVVPGHEIIGLVKKVGKSVTRLKVGEVVGIGCIIGSCKNCSSCHQEQEQYCDNGFVLVFNSLDPETQETNYGGFSRDIVVKEEYAIPIPKNFIRKTRENSSL